MAARILIVDDEPNILATVAPLLRARGYEVFTAMNGRAAIEAVDRDKPDLVVLDLGLPDIDGVDVCRAIREALEHADPRALGARRGRRQGPGARRRGRRLRHEAVRRRRAAGAHSRGAAASRQPAAADRTDRPRRPGDRSGAVSRAPGRRGGPADAEGVRAADVSGAASRSRAHAPHASSRRSGVRTPSISPSTCACWWDRCARRSSPRRPLPKYILTEPWVGYRFAES